MFCGIDIILQNISHIQSEYKEYFYTILPVPHNIVMNLNNFTKIVCSTHVLNILGSMGNILGVHICYR